MKSRIYPRWDVSQVRQHQLMIVSFTLLCATGLPLRYSDNNVSQVIAQHLGGASVAGLIHRLAASGLILCCVWHAIYLCGARRRGRIRLDMVPALSDVHEVLHQLRWLIGLESHEARFGRYGFVEKIEYWALIWGSVVMIATGLMLWFPVAASGWVTGLGIQLAKVVHGYEALLAFLAILIWHMYHAHLRRDVFPMSHTWLTGVLTEEEMAHHHPRELERIRQEEAQAAAAAPAGEDHEQAQTGADRLAGDAAVRGLRPADEQAPGDDHPNRTD